MKFGNNSKTRGSAQRGQSSIEFLVVIAFSFALAASLLASADIQLSNLSAIQRASVARAGLDSLAVWTNLVYLEGNASQETGRVFVPSNSACFILNTTFPAAGANQQIVYQCDVDPLLNGRVNSRELFTSAINLTNCQVTVSAYGWYLVNVYNTNGWVNVTCSKEA